MATTITTIEELDAIRLVLSEQYRLGKDLNFFDDDSYNDPANKTDYITGNGWLPIGTEIDPFTGDFDGDGYLISGLYINRENADYVGMFAYTNQAVLFSAGLYGVDVRGNVVVGGLVARPTNGTIERCVVTGSVRGTDVVGGLIGYNYSSISTCVASPNMLGESYVGGFVGINHLSGVVDNCYSTDSVKQTVGPSTRLGGFAGANAGGSIEKCYSVGSVPVGSGFVGFVESSAFYKDQNNFWDIEASGQTFNRGEATGKTTNEMQTIVTYTDTETEGLTEPWSMSVYDTWTPAFTWAIDEGNSYPDLYRLSKYINLEGGITVETFLVGTLYPDDIDERFSRD